MNSTPSIEEKKAKARAATAAWRAANPEKIKAHSLKHSKSDRTKELKKLRSARADVKAKAKAWREENREEHAARRAAWYIKNRDALIAASKEWVKKNPEQARIRRHNQRAKRRSASGKLSKGWADRLLKLQKWKCACCGDSLKNGYQLDHIKPIAKGGEHADNNIQLLTPTCNKRKGAKDPVQYT